MSSRARRRAGRGSLRSRRTPVRIAGQRGLRIPWVPVIVVVGIAGIVGIIAYLVWQQTKPAEPQFEQATRVEADPAPDLPGEYVNLPEIYGGFYGNEDGPTTAAHVTRDVDYLEDQAELPPVGGPHWGGSACGDNPAEAPSFCGPAPWGVYREPWEPETLVHNMEHGGIVVWYNTTNQEIIDELEDLIGDQAKASKAVVLAPYPEMETEHVAVTSWGRRDKFPVGEYSKDRVEDFIDVHLCRFNPEDLPGC